MIVLRIKILTILLLGCFALKAASPPDSIHSTLTALRNDLSLLQAYKEIQENAFHNKSVALDNQVEAIRQERGSEFYLLLGSAGGILLAVFGGYSGVYALLKMKAERHIGKKLKEEVNQQIPPLVGAGIKESLVPILQDNAAHINGLLHRHARIGYYRTHKKLLVLCDNAERAREMKALLKDRFQFDNVDTRVPKKYEHFEGYDLIIFDHENSIDDKDYAHLKNSLILEFLKSEPSRIMLYFGHYNPKLDDHTRTTAFANGRFTLYSRIVDVMDYLAAGEAANHVPSLPSEH